MAIAGAKGLAPVAAAVLGLVSPPAAALITAGAGVGEVLSAIRQRQRMEKERRFATLIQALHTRLKDLEDRVGTAEHEQLSMQHEGAFLGLLEAALADDEAAKLPFYEAAIEWLVRERPSPVKISMLRETLRRASYADIYVFLEFAARVEPSWTIMLNAFGVGEQAAIYRLAAVGLINEPVLPAERTGSHAGAVLARYTRLGSIPTLEAYARELGLLGRPDP